MKILPKLLLLFTGISCATGNHVSYVTNDFNGVISADSTGIYSKNIIFSPELLFPKTHWKGDWIWLNKTKYGEYQNTSTTWIKNGISETPYKALFRKNFILKEIPSLAILGITADVSFRTYINGNFVCQGPANIGSDYEDNIPPEHWFFTTHDVKNYMRIGENTIAIEVYSFDLALSETTSGKGKLICDLDIDLNRTFLSTDSTWKSRLDMCMSRENGGLIYDARHELPQWQDNSINDSDWSNASVVDSVKNDYLVMSQIPSTVRYPLEAVRIRQISSDEEIDKKTSEFFNQLLYDDSFALDFGRNMSAYYSFSITAHNGDTIKFYPREKSSVNRPFIYICKEGKNVYTTPQLNVFRYLGVEVNSREGLKIDSLYALYSSYPVSYAGSFSCSDTFYTKLWDIARWSTQICMNSLYLDSPMHQEPIACTGDYLIESLSNFYAFGDPWLARQDLIKTARMLKKNNYDMFHTSYSMLWIQMLFNYFQYTGDTLLVRELLPLVNNLNDLFATYLDENFLISQAPDYMFMDWVKIGKFNAHHPPAVIGMGYLTALFYKSLMIAAEFNAINHDKSKMNENIRLAEKIKIGMNTQLWDDNKGLYKDGIPFISQVTTHWWLPADEDILTYSPHVNTLVVLYDIAPEEIQSSIMDYVEQQKEIDLQPYFMYFVLSALTKIGKFESDGLPLINKWKDAIDLVTYTLKENWQDKTEFGYTGDYSHAWGGSPLYFMSSEILGITPEKPGYKVIRFDPYISDYLHWAKGTVPLGDGNIVSVFWERSGKTKYKYQIKIPDDCKVNLYHSNKSNLSSLRINQNIYGIAQTPLELSGGDYVIEYTMLED